MKTIIITGANSGIGFETAKQLALKGHTIIAASRKRADSQAKIAQIEQLCREQQSEGRVVLLHLDLSAFESVRAFAENVKSQFPKIDTLICNAGVMNTPYQVTQDGFELQFQTNFLSHFLLTHLLIDNLNQVDNPKVINVCSASAEKGRIDNLAALERISRVAETAYDPMTSYRESKLAQEISVMEFSRREAYRHIKFSLIHPGVVNTPLFYRKYGLWYKAVMIPFVYLGYVLGLFKTPQQGAATSIFLSENDAYESGRYWHRQKNLQPNPIAQDQTYSQAVWEWSLHCLNIQHAEQSVISARFLK